MILLPRCSTSFIRFVCISPACYVLAYSRYTVSPSHSYRRRASLWISLCGNTWWKRQSLHSTPLSRSHFCFFLCLSLLNPLSSYQASTGLHRPLSLWQEQQQWACDTSPFHRVNLPRAQITRDTLSLSLVHTHNTTPPSWRPQNGHKTRSKPNDFILRHCSHVCLSQVCL